jgi:hypothetical protein
MTRAMYDGTNGDAAAIAAQAVSGDLVAGYVDGLYAWSAAQRNGLRAGVLWVPIAVFATTNDGRVLDCERGNCTPAQSVDWVLMRRGAGVDPSVYCNEHDTVTGWPAVRAAFQARGVPEPHYWVADYDGVAEIPVGAVAKQYADDLLLGRPWDLSIVADYWPGVDPAPIDPPHTAAARRNDMHADLVLNKPVALTNPGAVTGQTAQLLLASDFGDATVRVALFSLKAAGWTVTNYTVQRLAGAIKVALPPDTNKVSVELTGGNGTVGLDVLA